MDIVINSMSEPELSSPELISPKEFLTEINSKSFNIIHNTRRENTPTSSIDDENRKELPWEKREEKLLLKWVVDMRIRSAMHDKLGRKNKILYSVFGVPSVLIPVILGGITPLVECNTVLYSAGMILTGMLTATNVFFNFSKKTHQHFESQKKLFELANEIEVELSKPKKHRIACSLYMDRIKLQYNLLI
jgi:hypothetical protein